MTTLQSVAGLSGIADDYDALLCDAWGVIHNGVDLFPGVEDAMTRFRARRGPVVILTNAPRPSSIIPPQLARIGLARHAWDRIVTSGDATRAAISRLADRPAFKLGPDKDEKLYEGLAIDFAPLDKAGFIVCTGLIDDEKETPDDYAALLAAGVSRKLPMICANPDVVVRWGGRLVYCAGALAAVYERLGGEVIYGGKPYTPIYDLALAAVEEVAGKVVERSRILAVGDGLQTDIAGANRNGFDALFIVGAEGIHDGGADARSVAAALAKAGVHARFSATRLQW
jgi:HAD superfamily hydrolase (TIGR01459 family)